MFTQDNGVVQQLEKGAAKLGVELNAEQLSLFTGYLDLLYRWHKLFNLTAVAPDRWVARHLLDSLSVYQFIPLTDKIKNCVDIGSGAGLPGIPLAIAMGSTNWYLVEKNTKKCGFLLRVKMELGLDNLKIVNASAEQLNGFLIGLRGDDKNEKLNIQDLRANIKKIAFGSELPKTFDLATGRSVFGSDGLLDYCHSLIKNGGVVLDMHGKYSGTPRNTNKWKVEKFSKVRVPNMNAARHVICWSKLS